MLQHSTINPWHPSAYTKRTHVLQIEFTTRCDLKCTYCAVSQPGWSGKDLDLTQFNYDDLIEAARSRQCQTLNLHGHGETTMLPQWVEYARKAVDTGIPITICSNFAHIHSEEETDILARFYGITISIDTVDHQLYKKLRRGGDLRTLMFNMIKLRSAASKLGVMPHLTWCCVLSDQNWRGMMELVKQGVDLGVTTFCICNLNILPTPKGGTELKHVSTLPINEAVDAFNLLRDCQDYSAACGAEFHLKSGILDTLGNRLDR